MFIGNQQWNISWIYFDEKKDYLHSFKLLLSEELIKNMLDSNLFIQLCSHNFGTKKHFYSFSISHEKQTYDNDSILYNSEYRTMYYCLYVCLFRR